MVDSKPVDDQSWRIIALFKTVEATYEEMMGGSEVLQSTENSSIFNLIDGRLFFAQCPQLNQLTIQKNHQPCHFITKTSSRKMFF